MATVNIETRHFGTEAVCEACAAVLRRDVQFVGELNKHLGSASPAKGWSTSNSTVSKQRSEEEEL